MLNLQKVIEKYLQYVKQFHIDLQEYYGICRPIRAYRSKILKQTGILKLSREVEYRFHGIGCEIKFKDSQEIIDFDYGPDMRIDGFDVWKIWIFLDSLNLSLSYEDIEEKFNQLEKKGVIKGPRIHKLDTKLYFL